MRNSARMAFVPLRGEDIAMSGLFLSTEFWFGAAVLARISVREV